MTLALTLSQVPATNTQSIYRLNDDAQIDFDKCRFNWQEIKYKGRKSNNNNRMITKKEKKGRKTQ